MSKHLKSTRSAVKLLYHFTVIVEDGGRGLPGNIGLDGQVVGADFDSGVADEMGEVGRRRRQQLRLGGELATHGIGHNQLFALLELCQQSLKSLGRKYDL